MKFEVGDRVRLIIGKQEGVVTDITASRFQVVFDEEEQPTWWFDHNWVRKVEDIQDGKKSRNFKP